METARRALGADVPSSKPLPSSSSPPPAIGVGWTKIGDVLGHRERQRVQRYRQRPAAPSAVAVDRVSAGAPGH